MVPVRYYQDKQKVLELGPLNLYLKSILATLPPFNINHPFCYRKLFFSSPSMSFKIV